MRVGMIGLGRMGAAFAQRLLNHGVPLGVWNRSRAKSDALRAGGAVVHDTPRRLAEANDAILVSLADQAALEEVYAGADGLLAAPLDGKIVAELSTVRPGFALRLAEGVRASRGDFLDTPVLGTVGPAREGRIVVVAGGDGSVLDRLRPVLSVLSRRTVHMGPVGAGAAMKLVVNMQLAAYWQILGESLSLGQRSGLDLGAMLDVLAESAIATPALAAKRPALMGEPAEVAFNIAGVHKDLCYALSAADAVGVRGEVAAAALAGYVRAVDGGLGQADVSDIVGFILRDTQAVRDARSPVHDL